MAIFHLSVKAIGRASGRSATAAAAYRAATRIADERTGLVHDYSRKGGVEHREIVVPEGAPAWAQDRARLWNAAELAETRRNSTVAREFEVALPGELAPAERRALACAFAAELTARHRCAVDLAIHAPGRGGDLRNHHAHLLLTTRRLAADGFTEKTRELDDLKSGEVARWRERWAQLVNERLAEHGRAERVDHRSLAAQGVRDRDPTMHKGPAVTAIERRQERSVVAERMREDIGERLQLAAERGRLEREAQGLVRSIIDTSADLQAALQSREATDGRALQEIRREAQAAWRDERGASTPDVGTRATDTTPALDLGGDVAAARRAAREQWLASREGGQAVPPAGGAEGAKPGPRIEIPGGEHAIK